MCHVVDMMTQSIPVSDAKRKANVIAMTSISNRLYWNLTLYHKVSLSRELFSQSYNLELKHL